QLPISRESNSKKTLDGTALLSVPFVSTVKCHPDFAFVTHRPTMLPIIGKKYAIDTWQTCDRIPAPTAIFCSDNQSIVADRPSGDFVSRETHGSAPRAAPFLPTIDCTENRAVFPCGLTNPSVGGKTNTIKRSFRSANLHLPIRTPVSRC